MFHIMNSFLATDHPCMQMTNADRVLLQGNARLRLLYLVSHLYAWLSRASNSCYETSAQRTRELSHYSLCPVDDPPTLGHRRHKDK